MVREVPSSAPFYRCGHQRQNGEFAQGGQSQGESSLEPESQGALESVLLNVFLLCYPWECRGGFSTGHDFVTIWQGTWGTFWRLLCLAQLEGHSWHLGGGGQKCWYLPYSAQDALTAKSHLPRNVSNAGVGKSNKDKSQDTHTHHRPINRESLCYLSTCLSTNL